MSDREELRRLAEAVESSSSMHTEDERKWMRRSTGESVIELLDELDEVRAYLECARGDLKTAGEVIERYKKDAERYRFLRSGNCSGHEEEPATVMTDDQSAYYREDLDKLIDRQMAAFIEWESQP